MGIPSIKIRRSLDRLIFIMGIPTLVIFKRPLIVESIGYSEYTHNKTMSSNVVKIFLRIYSEIVIHCCYSPDIVASPPQRILFHMMSSWSRHDVVMTSLQCIYRSNNLPTASYLLSYIYAALSASYFLTFFAETYLLSCRYVTIQRPLHPALPNRFLPSPLQICCT